jgi:hypothetical protein
MLLAALAIVGACLTLYAHGIPGGEEIGPRPKPHYIPAKIAKVPPEPPLFSTIEHDRHRWVYSNRTGYFVHHPDCDCRRKDDLRPPPSRPPRRDAELPGVPQ